MARQASTEKWKRNHKILQLVHTEASNTENHQQNIGNNDDDFGRSKRDKRKQTNE